MSEELDALYRAAVFGKETEIFLNSELGKYLCARAQLEAQAAMEAMVAEDPENVSEMRKHQNTIRRAENFRQWLALAVNDGIDALRNIEDRENG